MKEGLKQQGIQKQLPDFIAKLKGEANVEILDEKLKNAEVPAATRSGQSANEEVPAASRSSRSAKETGIVGKTKANVDKVLDGWSSRKSDRSSPSDPIYYYTKDVEIIVHFRNERAVGLAVIDRPGKGMSPITQTRFDELVALLGAKPEPTNITRDANGIREFSVGDPGDAH